MANLYESVEKMYRIADQKLLAEFGPGLHLLGSRIQRALYAEQLLSIIAAQDDGVSDARVRSLVLESYATNMD